MMETLTLLLDHIPEGMYAAILIPFVALAFKKSVNRLRTFHRRLKSKIPSNEILETIFPDEDFTRKAIHDFQKHKILENVFGFYVDPVLLKNLVLFQREGNSGYSLRTILEAFRYVVNYKEWLVRARRYQKIKTVLIRVLDIFYLLVLLFSLGLMTYGIIYMWEHRSTPVIGVVIMFAYIGLGLITGIETIWINKENTSWKISNQYLIWLNSKKNHP